MPSNHSLHPCCISKAKYLALLLLCNTLNLIQQCFKVKDKETKGKMANMFFQIAVNLICWFSFVNFMYGFSTYLLQITLYTCLHMYSCPPCLSITLFVCHFMSPCEVSKGIVSLYLCQFFYPSASVLLNFHLHWEIWLS